MYTPTRALSKHPLVLRFQKSEITVRASALAFHTLLAIVPLVGLVFWYLKHLGITRQWAGAIKELVLAQLNVSASEVFIEQFNKLTSSVGSTSWGYVGLAIFIYTSVSLLLKLGNSLDSILNTAPAATDFRPSIVKLFLKRSLVFLVVPLALGASLAFTSWIRQDSFFRYVFKIKSVGSWLTLPIPVLIDCVGLFFMYYLIPQRPIRGREAFKAALVTAIVFELAKYGVGAYNRHALMTQKLYGALSVIPVFIVWVQIAWMILLSGALLIRISPQTYVDPEVARSETS